MTERVQYAADPRCTYVDRPGGLPTAVFINEEAVSGPFCARCGHPAWMHRAKDDRCLKYANPVVGIHRDYRPLNDHQRRVLRELKLAHPRSMTHAQLRDRSEALTSDGTLKAVRFLCERGYAIEPQEPGPRIFQITEKGLRYLRLNDGA